MTFFMVYKMAVNQIYNKNNQLYILWLLIGPRIKALNISVSIVNIL